MQAVTVVGSQPAPSGRLIQIGPTCLFIAVVADVGDIRVKLLVWRVARRGSTRLPQAGDSWDQRVCRALLGRRAVNARYNNAADGLGSG